MSTTLSDSDRGEAPVGSPKGSSELEDSLRSSLSWTIYWEQLFKAVESVLPTCVMWNPKEMKNFGKLLRFCKQKIFLTGDILPLTRDDEQSCSEK
ncbi:hypothetical protein GN956_G11112 [Arapaima gigas]